MSHDESFPGAGKLGEGELVSDHSPHFFLQHLLPQLVHPQLPTKPTNQGGREVSPCPLWPCSLPSKKMQVQLPLLNGQKALDHVGIKHQQPQTDSVLGDSTVKVCHGGRGSREHMRDGRTEEELKQRLVDRWMTHTQMSPLPSSLCLYVSNRTHIWWLWSPFLQAGLISYRGMLNCTLRSGSAGAELGREQKSSKDLVSSRSGGIMLFQAVIYQMGPLNGKPNYLVVKETLSDLIDI